MKKPTIPKTKPRSCDAIDKYIGARLKMRRHEQGISQEKLGEGLGVSFQQIQKYEKGVNRVSVSALSRIAKLLDCDVNFFYPPDDGGPVNSTMTDFMATSDGLVIAEAFVRIKNPEVRHTIAASIRNLAGAMEAEG